MDDCGGECWRCDVCLAAGPYMGGAVGAELTERLETFRNAAERTGGSCPAHEQSQSTTHR